MEKLEGGGAHTPRNVVNRQERRKNNDKLREKGKKDAPRPKAVAQGMKKKGGTVPLLAVYGKDGHHRSKCVYAICVTELGCTYTSAKE